MSAVRMPRVHWPHLALLVALPAWAAWSLQALAPSQALAAWLVVNAVVLALAERRWPHRREWQPTAAHLRRDGGVFALNAVVDALAGAALAALAAHATRSASGWPLALQIAVALPLAEFGAYWLHRFAHRDGWLWRAHLMHHRPDRLNLANAVLAHPVNVVLDKFVRLLPLVLLGFDAQAIVVVGLFGLTQSLVAHANVAGGIGPLSCVIGSASLHRLHHSAREADAGNFGTALPLWDQVFGTYRRGPSPARVGVFDPSRYPSQTALLALLAWPFRRHRDRRPQRCCAAWGMRGG